MTFPIVRKVRSPRVLGLLAALPLLTAGCYKAIGGGWIQSSLLIGADKASFGFNARCVDIQENGLPVAKLYDGQLEWKDGPVQFHGIVGPEPFFMTLPGRCKDVRQMVFDFENVVEFEGTFQPKTGGESGVFTVIVIEA